MYKYDQYDQAMVDTRVAEFRDQTQRRIEGHLNEDQFKADIEAETGMRPWWALESFHDPFANVAQSIRRLQHSPFVFFKDHISGFVYDVDTGRLHPVAPQ